MVRVRTHYIAVFIGPIFVSRIAIGLANGFACSLSLVQPAMTKNTQDVIAELDAFQPADLEDDWLGEGYSRLRGVCAELMDTPQPEQGIDALFALFERLEGKDLGPPGPVVHTLEMLADYQAKLVLAVQRKPTTYTVWMVNRVLNSPLLLLLPERREFWLGLLQAASTHPLASATTKADAQRFIEYQQSVLA